MQYQVNVYGALPDMIELDAVNDAEAIAKALEEITQRIHLIAICCEEKSEVKSE